MAANLAMFLADAKTDVTWGATAGFLAGIWTFGAIAIHSLFELRSWRYIFINGGYSIVSLTIMGAILVYGDNRPALIFSINVLILMSCPPGRYDTFMSYCIEQ
jgi:hypothetical protein